MALPNNNFHRTMIPLPAAGATEPDFRENDLD